MLSTVAGLLERQDWVLFLGLYFVLDEEETIFTSFRSVIEKGFP